MHTTPVSLLLRLKQSGNGDAWVRFVKLYTPLLYFWAHKVGCPRDEADDLVQEIFEVLVRLLPGFEYDQGRSFRAYLRKIAMNKWQEKQRRARLAVQPIGDAGLVEAADPDPAEEFWEQEFREHLVRRALQLMQSDFPEQTWQICWAVVVESKPAAEVAAQYGLSVGAVHAARFRVVSRLREELAGLMD